MIEGKMYYAAPSHEPHGSQTLDLGSVLRASVARGYKVAVDMLTRTGEDSDFAPDVSVFPIERDPATGGRKLEELAFEVVDKQAMSIPTRKARLLAERGVRRVFCVKIRDAGRQLLEWDQAASDLRPLAETAQIADRCLALPIPVRSLLRAAEVDDAVARSLLARENPVLQAALQEREERGVEKGIEQGIEKGIERGALLAERAVLRRLLLKRFPAEAARIDVLVERWDSVALARATDALLDSPSFDDLVAAVGA